MYNLQYKFCISSFTISYYSLHGSNKFTINTVLILFQTPSYDFFKGIKSSYVF